MQTYASKNVKKTLLGISFILLFILIFGCFYLEIFQSDKLSLGSVRRLFVEKRLDTSNAYVRQMTRDFPRYRFSKFNIFSYFTQCSNFLAGTWALLYGLSLVFRIERLRSFCETPMLCTSLTTYTVIAGATVAAANISGMTQFQPFTSFWSVVLNLISIVYHYLTPLCMLAYCAFHGNARRCDVRKTGYTLLFPLAYCIFTVIRSIWIHRGFYPYFIFSPYNLWNIVGGGRDYNAVLSYLLMAVIFGVIALIFAAVQRLVTAIYNRNLAAA